MYLKGEILLFSFMCRIWMLSVREILGKYV